TDRIRFFVGPILHLLVPAYTGFRQDFLGRPPANTKNVRETYFASFMIGNINTCNTCHNYPCLCLYLGFFLLITYSLPLRRMILQSALRFMIDALTFIPSYLYLNVILPFVKS